MAVTPMTFELSKEQWEKIMDWRENHPIHKECKNKYHGAIGEHITYKFTPTSLGDIVIVRCSSCDCKIDISEYDSW